MILTPFWQYIFIIAGVLLVLGFLVHLLDPARRVRCSCRHAISFHSGDGQCHAPIANAGQVCACHRYCGPTPPKGWVLIEGRQAVPGKQ